MEPIIKDLEETVADWKARRTWGAIEIEVHDGQVALVRKETKQKYTSQAGGFNREPARSEHRQ